MGVKLHFISNIVKGLQNSLKRIKIFEYFTKKFIKDFYFARNPFIFSWWKEMDRWIKRTNIFSDGKTNSCGVAIGHIGSNKVNIWKKMMKMDVF